MCDEIANTSRHAGHHTSVKHIRRNLIPCIQLPGELFVPRRDLFAARWRSPAESPRAYNFSVELASTLFSGQTSRTIPFCHSIPRSKSEPLPEDEVISPLALWPAMPPIWAGEWGSGGGGGRTRHLTLQRGRRHGRPGQTGDGGREGGRGGTDPNQSAVTATSSSGQSVKNGQPLSRSIREMPRWHPLHPARPGRGRIKRLRGFLDDEKWLN